MESLPHDRRGYGPQGQCRRNPPTASPQDQHGGRWGTWPDVMPYDWCGEHRPRPSGPQVDKVTATESLTAWLHEQIATRQTEIDTAINLNHQMGHYAGAYTAIDIYQQVLAMIESNPA